MESRPEVSNEEGDTTMTYAEGILVKADVHVLLSSPAQLSCGRMALQPFSSWRCVREAEITQIPQSAL